MATLLGKVSIIKGHNVGDIDGKIKGVFSKENVNTYILLEITFKVKSSNVEHFLYDC